MTLINITLHLRAKRNKHTILTLEWNRCMQQMIKMIYFVEDDEELRFPLAAGWCCSAFSVSLSNSALSSSRLSPHVKIIIILRHQKYLLLYCCLLLSSCCYSFTASLKFCCRCSDQFCCYCYGLWSSPSLLSALLLLAALLQIMGTGRYVLMFS